MNADNATELFAEITENVQKFNSGRSWPRPKHPKPHGQRRKAAKPDCPFGTGQHKTEPEGLAAGASDRELETGAVQVAEHTVLMLAAASAGKARRSMALAEKRKRVVWVMLFSRGCIGSGTS